MEKEEHIIAVTRLNVTAENFAGVVRVAGAALQERLAALPGFVEGVVVTNEAKSRIIIEAEWTSRQMWAESEWDEQIARTVAELFEHTASYELEFFFPLIKVKSTSAS